MKKAVAWFLSWILMLALWFLFISKWAWSDFILGAIFATAAAIATAVVEGRLLVRFGPYARSVLELWRLPKYVVVDGVRVVGALGQRLFGGGAPESRVEAVAFAPVGESPEDSALRALAVTYGSIAPNFVALGVIREQRLLVYHQLRKTRLEPMMRNLGARP